MITSASVIIRDGESSVATVDFDTPEPNNNNTKTASPNRIQIGTKKFTSFEPIDIRFTVENTGGETEYFVTENSLNSTDNDWDDFHFELGFLVMNEDGKEEFQRSDGQDRLAFDNINEDPTPTNSVVGLNPPVPAFAADPTHHANTLDWSGGEVSVGGRVMFTYSIDVPDLSEFVLRQRPTQTPPPPPDAGLPDPFPDPKDLALVPEPSSLALLGMGGLTLFGYRLRRKRKTELTA